MTIRLGPQAAKVYSGLRDRILSGDLCAGSQLASQANMAHEFGVALLTVRQALAALEHDGLVRSEQGRGTFVHAQHPRADLPGSEATFRLMVEAAPLPIVCLDAAGKVKVWNHACESLFGWTEEEASGRRLPCLPEQDWDHFYGLHLRAIQGGTVTSIEWGFCTHDGSALDVAISMAPMLDASGYVLGTMLIALDITERKTVERALRQSEERYRTLVEMSPDAVTLIDLSGDTILANHRAAIMFGAASPDELIGHNGLDRIAPEDHERAMSRLPHTVARGGVHNVEYTLVRKDGTRFYADVTSQLVSDGAGSPMGLLSVFRDISERKRDEQAMAESEERYRALFAASRAAEENLSAMISASPLSILVLDTEGYVLSWNAAAEQTLGWSESEVVGKPIPSIPSEERDAANAIFRRVLAGESVTGVEVCRRKKDGTPITLNISLAPLRNSEGKVDAVLELCIDVSLRKKDEEALRQSEERFRAVFENAHVGIALADRRGTLIDANQAVQDMVGYDRDSLRRMTFADYTHPDDLAADRELFAELMAGKREYYRMSKRFVRSDSSVVWGEMTVSAVHGVDGSPAFNIAMIEDVTERKRGEEALRQSEARFRAVFDMMPDAVSLLTTDGTILMTNRRSAEMFRFDDPEKMIGLNRIDMVSSENRLCAQETLREIMDKGFVRNRQLTMVRSDGTDFPAELSSSVLYDQAGRIQAIVTVTRDISDRKRAEDALQHQSLHDVLTDLPNRTLLQDRLHQAVLTSKRDGAPFALLLMDLNRFKEVNDTFGHHTGDLLLQEVSTRLRGTLRDTDTVARLGGAEFAVLLPGSDATTTVAVARKILAELEEPFLLEGRQIGIETSIGASFYPEHGDDASTLLRKADIAMYVAKRSNDGYAVYSPKHEDNSARGLVLMAELRHAIDHGQLLLHYQPKVNFKTGDTHHVEALVRWMHPERGMVQPGDFIPLAERSGLIRPLTWWVLEEALRQWRFWHDVGLEVDIAVNLSAWCLQDEQFVEAVSEMLQKWSVKPSALRLEITESALMADPARAMTILTDLHQLGVKISIDDFGTGYSSLALLKQLPVDEIKIDKSFVLNMAHDQSDAVIVRSVVDLGHNLSLQVVAEGVEDQTSLDMLHTMGCDLGQGYFFSRPSNPVEIERFLRRATQGKNGTWKQIAG